MELRGTSTKRNILTLSIIHQHPRVLLGMKKRGFGQGRWNGFGGKVSNEETIEQAARREIFEEAGIEVEALEKVAILEFQTQGIPEIHEVHVFRAQVFTGQPKESEEMKPQWFHIDSIPFAHMWSDDQQWFPLFLRDKKFKGKFLFDDADNILKQTLAEVQNL